MEDLKLGLPENTIFKQFMPKGQFYEHGEFTQAEKNIFINCIERITLYAQLSRGNTNINTYKDSKRTYEEVSVFLIKLKKKDNMDRIAKLVMNTIPYPMILVGKYKEEYIFYGAHQRDNKIDDSKVILEKIYNSGWVNIKSSFMERINYKNLSKYNLYEFYKDYIDSLIEYNLEKRNIRKVSNNNSEELLEKIRKIEEELSLLKNKMSRERQFNRKMDLNIKIKKLEKELENMEG